MKLLNLLLVAILCIAGCSKKPIAFIDSSIPGATVLLDGKPIGVTPLKLYPADLKKLDLSAPFEIRKGNSLWKSWDYAADSANNMTISAAPNATRKTITFLSPPGSNLPLKDGAIGKSLPTYGMNSAKTHFTVLFPPK